MITGAPPNNTPAGRDGGPSVLRVPAAIFAATFDQLRTCGQNRAECQALWVGPWSTPDEVTEVVHPKHRAHRGGFVVDDAWITQFFFGLAGRDMGIRAQVHTHPSEAFHSASDDAYPAVHTPGFFSLVIPDFALGPVTLERTYLARLGADGRFRDVDPFQTLNITP